MDHIRGENRAVSITPIISDPNLMPAKIDTVNKLQNNLLIDDHDPLIDIKPLSEHSRINSTNDRNAFANNDIMHEYAEPKKSPDQRYNKQRGGIEQTNMMNTMHNTRDATRDTPRDTIRNVA